MWMCCCDSSRVPVWSRLWGERWGRGGRGRRGGGWRHATVSLSFSHSRRQLRPRITSHLTRGAEERAAQIPACFTGTHTRLFSRCTVTRAQSWPAVCLSVCVWFRAVGAWRSSSVWTASRKALTESSTEPKTRRRMKLWLWKDWRWRKRRRAFPSPPSERSTPSWRPSIPTSSLSGSENSLHFTRSSHYAHLTSSVTWNFFLFFYFFFFFYIALQNINTASWII